MCKKMILFAVALVHLLPITVFAHPGRTDGSGGHTDKDTGEYHYHHGYPAHDHWDMDGDGDIDCPYDFDDKTNHNGGTNSNSSNAVGSSDKNNLYADNRTEERMVPEFIYWVIGFLVFTIVIMCIIIHSKNKTIASNEESFHLREVEADKRVKEGLTFLHHALTQKYGKDYLYEISDAPDGDYLGEDMKPHSAGARTGIGLDCYTFYFGGISRTSDTKYHNFSCRYARTAYPVNAMYLRDRRRYLPCMLCSCKLPDTAWVDKYQKHYNFLKKYIDETNLNRQRISGKTSIEIDCQNSI